jgi:hypothetical protein
MGLTAVASSTGGATADSLATALSAGVGGFFIATSLVLLLAYLNLLDGIDADTTRTRSLVIASILPLSVAFATTLLVRSVQAI